MKAIISVQGIKNDLENGVTRLKSDNNYNPEVGSIEEKYGLTPTQVSLLFKEPNLKGLRVKPKPITPWILVDTDEEAAQLMGETTEDIEESTVSDSTPEDTSSDVPTLIPSNDTTEGVVESTSNVESEVEALF